MQDCFELINDISISPEEDKINLLDWVIFNFMIANADAHAKNISILYMPDGPRLAPFYDMLCTAVYGNFTTALSMYIHKKNDPRYVSVRDWIHLSEFFGIGMETLIERRDYICNKATSEIDSVIKSLLIDDMHEQEFISRIEAHIFQRITWLERMKQ